ncbi:MAG: XTP/dITP diphosphatase [Candidatus Thermoplasmatota archaeon]
MKRIYFITSNKGKYNELRHKIESSGYNIILEQKDMGYPEIQADTLEEVAEYGIRYIRDRCSDPCIIEDSGLFINALKNFPGVYSKYVYLTIGLDGVLRLMSDKKNEERSALFKSVFAYVDDKSEPVLFTGECKGLISDSIRGTHGFGYDPIFIPSGSDRTFAEMSTKEKNHYSHRGKSMDKLLLFLKNK